MTKIISWLMSSSLTRPAYPRFGGGYGIDGRMGFGFG